MATDDPLFRPGFTFSDFRLEERLGGGQDGEVWRATRLSIPRVCAIKFLKVSTDPEKLVRFEREIDILARLNHNNIVSILQRDEATDQATGGRMPCYAMEYLAARPLKTALRDVPAGERFVAFCGLIAQTCAALQAVHLAGIAHGDVKSANILVSDSGGDLVAKLADFGFGLMADERRTRKVYTPSSHKAPAYLSPQQADMYRLGKTIEDCLGTIAPLADDLQRALGQLVADVTQRPQEVTASEVRDRIQLLRDQPRLAASFLADVEDAVPELGAGVARIQVGMYGDIALSARAVSLINTPAFQRLRHLRAFPIAELVYPSLSTSTLALVLGEYASLRAYLDILLRDARIRDALGSTHISALFLVLLVRHIADPPFASALAARGSFGMEERTVAFLRDPSLRSVIESEWRLSADLVADLVVGRDRSLRTPTWRLIASTIDHPFSPIAYESYHRVAREIGFSWVDNRQRLYRGVHLADDGESLVMDASVLREFEGILQQRAGVIERVFDHHTVRSAETMLGAALADLESAGADVLAFDDRSEVTFLSTASAAAEQLAQSRATFLLSEFLKRRLFPLVLSRQVTNDLWLSGWGKKTNLKRRRLEEHIAEAAGVAAEDVLVELPSMALRAAPSVAIGAHRGPTTALIDALLRQSVARERRLTVFVSRRVRDRGDDERVKSAAERLLALAFATESSPSAPS
jgi:hypothetical protein